MLYVGDLVNKTSVDRLGTEYICVYTHHTLARLTVFFHLQCLSSTQSKNRQILAQTLYHRRKIMIVIQKIDTWHRFKNSLEMLDLPSK